MSDKARLAALEATLRAWIEPWNEFDDYEARRRCDPATWERLHRTRTILATPAPEARTVTLALAVDHGGGMHFAEPGSAANFNFMGWSRLGTVTLPLDAEGE